MSSAGLLGRLCLAVGCCTLSFGCAVRVHIQSDPVGAAVTLNGEQVGVTPLELEVPFSPIFMKPAEVRLALPQHRPLVLDLGRQGRLYYRGLNTFFHPLRVMGIRPVPVTTVLLIDSHGPAGTWTVE
ncbi:MAG: PEGA domain-containing protein [Myxococcota bacterium]|nr:PEGA domain-containing protein [Myxococcota bacterium]